MVKEREIEQGSVWRKERKELMRTITHSTKCVLVLVQKSTFPYE